MSRLYTRTRVAGRLHFPIMAPEMSTSLKQRMVTWYLEDSLTYRNIVRLAGCSISRVSNVMHNFRNHSQSTVAVIATGRLSIVRDGDITNLFSLLAANSVLYLDELQT
ncbi:hypothetical protein M405DRAFT_752514 [Rhizopogon salebrosus TDB-379]|nr:hypothetical protein M405DRAFT_752514 [Rhizopogon salebrosus TDB-379]